MFKSYIINSEKYYLLRKYSFWFYIISNPLLYILIGILKIDDIWHFVFLFLYLIITIIMGLKFNPRRLIHQQKNFNQQKSNPNIK
ncbi:MAG: hypothetical protein UZ11_BCD004000607 [Bacteroidetes bacterium OLB11]|nr:MAG: hypothetical protein UZ11_BCD004000607 [Bacteroidetes bacterium OLB11]